MKNRQSLLTWGIIIAILIGSGLLTIFWPAISGMLGGGTTVPAPENTVTIPLPIPVGGRSEIVTSGGLLIAVIAFLVIGAVITTGIVLTIASWLISRFITNTTTTPEYQAESTALNRKVETKVKAKRAERPVHKIPETTWEKWAKATTILSVMMLVAFGAYLIASSIWPHSIVRNDQIVNIVSLVVLISVAVAFVVMLFWVRGRRMTADATVAIEAGPIPWDFIIVVLTGALVVGLGIGIIALLNS